jgi:hypothetical protein
VSPRTSPHQSIESNNGSSKASASPRSPPIHLDTSADAATVGAPQAVAGGAANMPQMESESIGDTTSSLAGLVVAANIPTRIEEEDEPM